ncbi:interleukin-5 receptor subunit alpha-like [Acipenser oxyrinchus oxyrinchus]|uniref:Interleukin-5 receptor subunit alpha-like n=1 Tax=Acipenser oxyrinchus oxyrinchus TaxID=40147 RepID=A0AAD8D0S2_ACIOX|nr:interleukin-5 receptor subunit alpha-like [Acipenser oxyrinchus oxyrinchus]
MFVIVWTFPLVWLMICHPCLAQESNRSIDITNVQCIIYNISMLNCTWDTTKEVPEGSQFIVHFKQDKHAEACYLYIQKKQKEHFKCHFQQVEIKYKELQKINISVNGSSKDYKMNTYSELFNPFSIEKLNPPVNVSLSLSANNIILTWEQPPTEYNFSKKCFNYEIKDSNDVKSLRSFTGNESISIISPRADTSIMAFQVRVNGHSRCRNSGIWSDWSVVYLKQNHIPKYVGPVVASVIITLILVISFFLCKRLQIKDTLFPPIPDPKKPFIGLFQSHNKDFKQWIGGDAFTETTEQEETVTMKVV